VAAVAGLLAAGPALGYVRTTKDGLCLWWGRRSIPFTLNDFGARPAPNVCTALPDTSSSVGSASAAARAAFATWAGATRPGEAQPCTDLSFAESSTSSIATGVNGTNLVVWRHGPCAAPIVADGDRCLADGTCADVYNCWDHGPSYVALTTVKYSTRTGEIVNADVELNGWDGGSSSAGSYFTCLDPGIAKCAKYGDPSCIDIDVQTVVVHEAGHLLGLDHAEAGTVMYKFLGRGEVRRSLTGDDAAGACGIYPAGGATVTCLPEKHGCSTAGGDGLLGLAAAAWLARRSGRRPRPAQYTNAPAYPTTAESSPLASPEWP
jgi:hypothetical protein